MKISVSKDLQDKRIKMEKLERGWGIESGRGWVSVESNQTLPSAGPGLNILCPLSLKLRHWNSCTFVPPVCNDPTRAYVTHEGQSVGPNLTE